MAKPHPTLHIYRASAGSGKTFRLAVEYISLLILSPRDDEFRHILAVTFTNKATAEMKDRILGQLYGLSQGLSSSQSYLRQVSDAVAAEGKHMTDEQIQQKATEVLRAILHDYSYFRVETIDSFFQSILRHLAHELGLSANLQVELGDKEVISQAVDKMIDSITEENSLIAQWILEYVNKKLEDGKSWDVVVKIKELATCIYKEEFNSRTQKERETLANPQQVTSFRDRINEIKRKENEALKAEVKQVIQEIDNGPLPFSRISYGDSRWKNFFLSYADKMKEVTLSPEKLNALYEDSSLLLVKKDKSILAAEAEVVADKLRNLYENYQSHFRLYKTCEMALKYINELRLLGTIEEYATQVATENNQFLLSRTPTFLQQLIQDCDAPFVYEKAGINFKHVMIDEFQDTSRMQWDNFKVLLFNNMATGYRNLIVGDIKQSIYRWRGGDWALLQNINTPPIGIPGANISTMQKNFRSNQCVVEFNNGFFPFASHVLDKACSNMNHRYSIEEIYADVHQDLGSSSQEGFGYVGVHLCTEDKKTLSDEEYIIKQAHEIRREILQLVNNSSDGNNLTFNDIAILVRKKDVGKNLIKAFREIEEKDPEEPVIPLISDEAFLLSSSIAVQMIISALHILSKTAKESIVHQRYLTRWYQEEVLHTSPNAEYLLLSSWEKLLPKEFVENRKELSQMPLYLLCERIYTLFNLAEIKGQDAYLMTFMDHVKQFASSNVTSISAFIQAWNESISQKSIPGCSMDGVRIVTIHKSKGLEYHTVILPDLSWNIEMDQPNSNDIWSKAGGEFDALGSLPISSTSSTLKTLYAPYYEDEHLYRRVDSLNILYVAFTRARCNLLMWGRTDGSLALPSSPNCWTDVLKSDSVASDLLKLYILKADETLDPASPELHWEVGKRVCHKAIKEDESNRLSPSMPPLEQMFHSHVPTQTFMPSNANRQFVHELTSPSGQAKQEAWEVGIIVHDILSSIANFNQVDDTLKKLHSSGLIYDEALSAKVKDCLSRGFALPEVKRWFDPQGEVFNECTITGRDPETSKPIVRRPDRVVLYPQDIYIVDFKLGSHKPKYEEQVRLYMQFLQRMYPSHRVHGALWFILQSTVLPITI